MTISFPMSIVIIVMLTMAMVGGFLVYAKMPSFSPKNPPHIGFFGCAVVLAVNITLWFYFLMEFVEGLGK